jgi:hypothetical protein
MQLTQATVAMHMIAALHTPYPPHACHVGLDRKMKREVRFKQHIQLKMVVGHTTQKHLGRQEA